MRHTNLEAHFEGREIFILAEEVVTCSIEEGNALRLYNRVFPSPSFSRSVQDFDLKNIVRSYSSLKVDSISRHILFTNLYCELPRNMDNMDAGRTSASHSARLDRSLLVLQDRVKEHEIALENVDF